LNGNLDVSGTALVTGVLTTTAATVHTGGITMPDSAIAKFGTGSDLQIYHDGSNSIIYEGGTGDLQLRGNGGSTTIMNGGGTETLANFGNNGSVDLYYDNAPKLSTTATGIDVTGTAVTDGLIASNVSGTTLIQAVGSDSNGFADVEIKSTGTSGSSRLYFSDTAGQSGSIKYSHSSDAMLFSTAGTSRLNIASNGDINFYATDGITQAFHWDATDSFLGLGITAPVRPLHVQLANDGGSVSTAIFENSASLAGSQSEIILVSGGNTSRGASISSYNESATGQPASMLFSTSAAYATPTERMRIDSSGNVGIGTSSPIYTSATRTTTTINGTASANLSFGVNGTGYGNIYADSASFELGSTTNSNPVKFTIGGTERMRIDASGNVVVGDTSAQASNAATLMADGEVTAAGFYFSNNIGAAMNDTGIRRATTSSMVFDTASTERMRIDASGRVGIGTSPDFPLHVSSTGVVLGLNATSGAVSQRFNENGTARFFLSTLNGSNGLAFVNGDGTSERMRIDSSGNLGLGMAPTTNNISKSISLVNGGSIFGYGSGTYITANSNYNGAFNTVATGPDSKMLLDGNVIFSRSASASAGTAGAETESMRITSAGLVGIGGNGTGNGLGVYLSRGTGANFFEASDGTKTMITGTDSTQDFVKIGSLSAHPVGFVIGNSEKMRIDASGNLLVGKTATAFGTAGVEASAGSGVWSTRSGFPPASFNRLTNDGDIASFYKDGTTVGSIGAKDGDLTIGNGDTGLYFSDGVDAIYPYNTSTQADRDAAVDLGYSTVRFKDLYLSGDVITGGGGTGNTGEIQFVADSTRARIVGGYDSGGGGYIAFRTDTTGGTDLERARFNNAGNLSFTSGNGIDFSAVTGGTGTATSNTLDDYEEGTFTPTAFGTTAAGTTTYVSQTGSYTKVGDTVHVDIYISWSAMTGTGDLRIGGLPFTSSSASNYYATGTIVPLLGFTWPSGKTQINPIIDASATAMSIYGSATDSNSDGAATDNEIVALAITITYKV
jgi:hypothetical protein